MLSTILLFTIFISNTIALECLNCREKLKSGQSDSCCLKRPDEHRICYKCFDKNFNKKSGTKLKECPGCKSPIFYALYARGMALLDWATLPNITVEDLRKLRFDTEVADEDRSNIFLKICDNKRIQIEKKRAIIEELLKLGFTGTHPNILGDTPLSVAVANRDTDTVEFLLSKDIDPESTDERPDSRFGNIRPMTEAVQNNDTAIMLKLREKGAKFLQEDLEWAYYKKSLDAAKLLIEHIKIDADEKGLFEKTLLMWAEESGNTELLEKTVDLSTKRAVEEEKKMLSLLTLFDVFNGSNEKIGEYYPLKNKLVLTLPTTISRFDCSTLLPAGEYHGIRGKLYESCLLQQFNVPENLKLSSINAYYQYNDNVIIQLHTTCKTHRK